jgi:hypothetical protein
VARLGYVDVVMLVDEDGDARGIEARLGPLADCRVATDARSTEAVENLGRVKCGS